MSTTEQPPVPHQQEPNSPQSRDTKKSSQYPIEFLVVLAFAFLPSLVHSIISFVTVESNSPESHESPVRLFLGYLPQMAAMCIPLLYIVHINRGSWNELGLLRPKWIDLATGIVLFIVNFTCAYVVLLAVSSLRTSDADATQGRLAHIFPSAKTSIDYVAIALASIAVGFGEELLFRGYILSRWQAMSGSASQAVLVSSILFGIAHTYQGLLGVVSAAVTGIVFGFAFIFLRRLWPLVIVHALTDFILMSIR